MPTLQSDAPRNRGRRARARLPKMGKTRADPGRKAPRCPHAHSILDHVAGSTSQRTRLQRLQVASPLLPGPAQCAARSPLPRTPSAHPLGATQRAHPQGRPAPPRGAQLRPQRPQRSQRRTARSHRRPAPRLSASAPCSDAPRAPSTLVRAMLLFAPATLARHVPLPASLAPWPEVQLERDLLRLEDLLKLERAATVHCVRRDADTGKMTDIIKADERCTLVSGGLAQVPGWATCCADGLPSQLQGKTFLPGGKCSGDADLTVTVNVDQKKGDKIQVNAFGIKDVTVTVPKATPKDGSFVVPHRNLKTEGLPWQVAGQHDSAKTCNTLFVHKPGDAGLQMCQQRARISPLHGCVKDVTTTITSKMCSKQGRPDPCKEDLLGARGGIWETELEGLSDADSLDVYHHRESMVEYEATRVAGVEEKWCKAWAERSTESESPRARPAPARPAVMASF